MTPTLSTKRLTLRPVTLADAPAIQRGIDNWNVVRELSLQVPWPYPPDGAVTFLRDVLLPAMAEGRIHAWVLALKPDGEAIGIIDLRLSGSNTGHRGFWLAEPYWGRGLMTEAVEATQDWLFFELGVDAIEVANASSNARSRRIKEKTGAVYLRTVDLPHHHGDSAAEVWRVTREAWAAHRGRAR